VSLEQNTILYEKAAEIMDYWVGTMWERVIQADLDRDDLEALAYHVAHAAAEMAIQEDTQYV